MKNKKILLVLPIICLIFLSVGLSITHAELTVDEMERLNLQTYIFIFNIIMLFLCFIIYFVPIVGYISIIIQFVVLIPNITSQNLNNFLISFSVLDIVITIIISIISTIKKLGE